MLILLYQQVKPLKTKTKTNSNSNELQTSQIECVGTHEEPLCNEDFDEEEFEALVKGKPLCNEKDEYEDISDEEFDKLLKNRKRGD